MKHILITGVNSYIGNKFADWISQWPGEYKVTKISVRNNEWEKDNWSKFDVLLHVAGIAHNSSDPSLEDLYYAVNRDLTIKVAKKARNEGIQHFIYLSSIIIFGTQYDCIDARSTPTPDNFYGDSKLQAEQNLELFDSSEFKVSIVRPPMVYGEGAKGNYRILSKFAKKTPLFPYYDNRRSMLYIDNLTELLRLIIDNDANGYFHPQNSEYVKTVSLVEYIAQYHSHRIFLIHGLGKIIGLFKKNIFIQKIFGDLYYDKKLSELIPYNYQIVSFDKSIIKTELGRKNEK